MAGSGHFEVEIKFRLPHSVDQFHERLRVLGAAAGVTRTQCDLYFNHPVRDFAQTDEALRIRIVDQLSWLTWKGPKIDAQTKTRRELELPLGDGTKSADELREILLVLGFRFVAEVSKQRQSFSLKRGDRDFEIVIDSLDRIGHFVEIELLAELSELDAARSAVVSLANELGLTEPVRTSYLELVLAASDITTECEPA